MFHTCYSCTCYSHYTSEIVIGVLSDYALYYYLCSRNMYLLVLISTIIVSLHFNHCTCINFIFNVLFISCRRHYGFGTHFYMRVAKYYFAMP